MPKAILWKHTHPAGTCRDFDRLIPTRETGRHRGGVSCKLCLDWLTRVDHAEAAPQADSTGEAHRATYLKDKVAPNLFSVFCSCGRSSFGAMLRDTAEAGHARHMQNPEGDDYRDQEATSRLLALIGPLPATAQ